MCGKAYCKGENMPPLKIIALDGFADRAQQLQNHIQDISGKKQKNLTDHCIVRFSNGEGKVRINETVRSQDLYIIADVGNYSCTYKMYGTENRKSPDDHFADIKRTIGAAASKPARTTVVMPLLYASRQHKRSGRESLDCAIALQELVAMGVDNIITFDAHDPSIQNAIPTKSFESISPIYPILKTFIGREKKNINKEKMIVVSPDMGAVRRAVDLAGMLGLDMGMFHKRRDYSKIVDGKNPVIEKAYAGPSLENKICIIVDDMIASGDSVIEVAEELKTRGAESVIVIVTFGLFIAGMERFDVAHANGTIKDVYCTNLSYVPKGHPKWLTPVDLTKFMARILIALNKDESISNYIDSKERIKQLLQETLT
jgi:ribose-phosphate pyrophosphokinase